MPQMRSYGKEAPIHRWRLSIDLSMMIIRFQRWEQLLVIKTTDEEVWQVPKRVWLAKDKLYFSYHISFSIIIPWIINLIMAPILASHLERFRKHPQSWINLERTKVVAASFCRWRRGIGLLIELRHCGWKNLYSHPRSLLHGTEE